MTQSNGKLVSLAYALGILGAIVATRGFDNLPAWGLLAAVPHILLGGVLVLAGSAVLYVQCGPASPLRAAAQDQLAAYWRARESEKEGE